jgi:hypothetical protein
MLNKKGDDEADRRNNIRDELSLMMNNITNIMEKIRRKTLNNRKVKYL